MKRHFLIWLIVLATLTSCRGQTTMYFEPTDINDRTKEFISKAEWISLKDKERIDGYTRIGDSIFGGEIACNIEPLQNIDIETFKVLPGTQYAKDKNYVYYPLEIPCVDYEDCGVCYFGKIIVEGANPEKFKYLGKEYATDDSLVFFRGELIEDADGKTFRIIEGPEFFFFATDRNNVYKHNRVFPNADPKTFFYNNSDPRNKETEYDKRFIISDKNNTWEYIPPHQIKKIKK